MEFAFCGLSRTPKVYNALITTDQNLTPSRAYPVIQPHIHETPYIPYAFNGYNPFSFYDPYSQISNLLNSRAYDTRKAITANDIPSSAERQPSDNAIGAIGNTGYAAVNGDGVSRTNTETSPIPLNEFGLPPSLIQLQGYGGTLNPQHPVSLAPFSFSTYPLIYDQFAGYPQAAYLPHFGYFPPSIYGQPTDSRPPVASNGAGIGTGTDGPLNPLNGGNDDGIAASSNTNEQGSTGGGTVADGGTDNGVENGVGNGVGSGLGSGAGSGLGGGSGNSLSSTGNTPSVAANDDNSAGQTLGSGGSGSNNQVSYDHNNGQSASGGRGGGQGQQSNFQSGSSQSQSTVSQGISTSSAYKRTGRKFFIDDDRIKNFPNKNKDIRDVPPPPLPFGAKFSEE